MRGHVFWAVVVHLNSCLGTPRPRAYRSVFADEFFRDDSNCQPDEKWNNEQIIEISNHGNEIRNEINRRQSVCHRATKQPTPKPGTSRIRQNRAIHRDFVTECPSKIFQPCNHVVSWVGLLCRPASGGVLCQRSRAKRMAWLTLRSFTVGSVVIRAPIFPFATVWMWSQFTAHS